MTEEDQRLVAKAALVGVRFWQVSPGLWTSSQFPSGNGLYSIGRAAMWALFKLEMVTGAEHKDYLARTHDETYHFSQHAQETARIEAMRAKDTAA